MATETAETKKITRGRQDLADRLAKRNPDRNFESDDDFYGQIYDDYDGYDAMSEENGRLTESNKRYADNEKKLTDMFSADPRSADFLADWANGGDPVVALVKRFGTEIKDAIDDPEKLEELATANKDYLAEIEKESGFKKEYEDNVAKSFEGDDKALADGTLTKDDLDKAHEVLGDLVNRYVKGSWTTEDLLLVLKSVNHDADVKAAADEGEVRGRNAKIIEQKKSRKSGDGLANNMGGNAGNTNTTQQKQYGALDNAGKKSIWDRGNVTRRKLS